MTDTHAFDSQLATSQPLDLLVVAVHPDDAELGAGERSSSLLARGSAWAALDLTTGEPTPHGSDEKRMAETAAASKVLGLAAAEEPGTSEPTT